MNRNLPLFAITLGTAACGAPLGESTALQPARQCFYASQVTGFTNAGQDRTLVNINRRASWELTLSPGCSNIDWALDIGIVSRGSQRICSGADAELIVPRASGSSTQRCLVRSIRKLSPAEIPAARGEKPR